jgi:spore coat polysaccharide biosynthesis protein SpsF
MQSLDVEEGVTILDNIIECIKTIPAIDAVVLAIAEGTENEIFTGVAEKHGIQNVVGSESDVLSRLILAGRTSGATDIFRVTSESPFMHFELVERYWEMHVGGEYECTFLDDAVDGCGFEILSLESLEQSHARGDQRHRSEFCTLYIREHLDDFKVIRHNPDRSLIRKDLRLTVDNPEDLVVCRKIYSHFKKYAPRIPVGSILGFLDENPELKALVAPFTDLGYSTMYVWKQP